MSESADSESCRVQKTLSVLFLCSFRSSKLTPQPPCIFHDLCWLTSSLWLSHFLSYSPLTFTATRTQTHMCTHASTQTGSHAHRHTFFHSQLSYLPKPSKTISLTNSLPNAEWHFILRRQRGQKDTKVDERK